MTNHPSPIFAGPAPALSREPVTGHSAGARRRQRTYDGWLTGFIRGLSASRRAALPRAPRVGPSALGPPEPK